MDIEFDPAKDAGNLLKHGLPLAAAEDFEWQGALIREDVRRPYAERRFEALGYIGDRLCVLVYCLRSANVRVISLRKANAREVRRYAET